MGVIIGSPQKWLVQKFGIFFFSFTSCKKLHLSINNALIIEKARDNKHFNFETLIEGG